jgi:hypothetical protein
VANGRCESILSMGMMTRLTMIAAASAALLAACDGQTDGAARLATPTLSQTSTATRPPGGEATILFRVQVSSTGLQSRWLENGKRETDFVEVSLAGTLHDPPLQLAVTNRGGASWDAPVSAALSDFSAFKADDDDWILENFVSEEHGEVRDFLNNADLRELNRRLFEDKEHMYVSGEVEYRGFVFVLAEGSEQATPRPLTFEKTDEGWKRTNKLSDDQTFDIVFSALASGEYR